MYSGEVSCFTGSIKICRIFLNVIKQSYTGILRLWCSLNFSGFYRLFVLPNKHYNIIFLT